DFACSLHALKRAGGKPDRWRKRRRDSRFSRGSSRKENARFSSGLTRTLDRATVAIKMASEAQVPAESAPALFVRNVSHKFGDTLALDDVSLEVPRGAFVMLLGLNGAGKSTLFELVTRLYDNVTGEIRIFGYD